MSLSELTITFNPIRREAKYETAAPSLAAHRATRAAGWRCALSTRGAAGCISTAGLSTNFSPVTSTIILRTKTVRTPRETC